MLIKQAYLRIFVKLIGGTHGKNEVTGLRGYGITGLRFKIPTVKTPIVRWSQLPLRPFLLANRGDHHVIPKGKGGTSRVRAFRTFGGPSGFTEVLFPADTAPLKKAARMSIWLESCPLLKDSDLSGLSYFEGRKKRRKSVMWPSTILYSTAMVNYDVCGYGCWGISHRTPVSYCILL
jgi:hypothetical protein